MSILPVHHIITKQRRQAIAVLVAHIMVIYLILLTIITFVHPYMQESKNSSNSVSGLDTSMIVNQKPKYERDTHPWGYDFSTMPDGPLMTNDWNFEEGVEVANYNNEAQAYTARPDNVRIENGLLILEAKPEKFDGKKYTSARIHTLGAFDFTYGTLEVDMMLPRGVGTWPAAWLMPSENRYDPSDYGIHPNDQHHWVVNGEIDFMEAIGSIPGENIPAAHSYNLMKRETLYTPGIVAEPYTRFHKYGIVKTPGKIEFTIDGNVFATREKMSDNPLDWPFEQPYYLILNLALGGNWAGVDGIDDASAPWQLKIKSISYTPPEK